jgi:hypothetical protein
LVFSFLTKKSENEGEKEGDDGAVSVCSIKVENQNQLRKDDNVDKIAAQNAEKEIEQN